MDTRANFIASIPLNGNLLDIGSSDGQTLKHFFELRPDLNYFATDREGNPENYPEGCKFHRGDIQLYPLPWQSNSIDAVTCMHLIEHLTDYSNLINEVTRVLKKGGKAYFETPHPKSLVLSSPSGKNVGTFTLNFFDDPTHIRPVVMGAFAELCRKKNLNIVKSGRSRNILFAILYFFLFFFPASRMKYICYIHFIGWSVYCIAKK
jgi:SAM-dependent methyltransferase